MVELETMQAVDWSIRDMQFLVFQLTMRNTVEIKSLHTPVQITGFHDVKKWQQDK